MRLKFIFILLLLYSGHLFGQMNPFSKHLQEHDPIRLNMITDYAKEKWNTKTDLGLIEYEVNKQSEGYVKVMALLHEHWDCQSHKTTIVMEMMKNSDDKDDFTDTNWWLVYIEIKDKLN